MRPTAVHAGDLVVKLIIVVLCRCAMIGLLVLRLEKVVLCFYSHGHFGFRHSLSVIKSLKKS